MNEPLSLDLLRKLIPLRHQLLKMNRSGRLLRQLIPAVDFPQASRTQYARVPATRLAIDFGTSAISVALLADIDVSILRFQGAEADEDAPWLDSLMGLRVDLDRSRLSDNYNFVRPERLANSRGWSLFPCLKRRIELLARKGGTAGWQSKATLDVAATCIAALSQARRDRSGELLLGRTGGNTIVGPIYLSVPNSFPGLGVEVLRQGVAHGVAAALEMSELPEVETILEAEAVAYREIKLLREQKPAAPFSLLVIDAGAGTTDASVVRVEGEIIRVVAHTGLPVGGLDLDALIAQALTPRQNGGRPGFGGRIRRAEDLKRKHWGRDASSAVNGPEPAYSPSLLAERSRALATVAAQDSKKDAAGLADELGKGYARFLALAVGALIRGLPPAEIRQVNRVVLSGRSSLLLGFREEVAAVMTEIRGDQVEIAEAASPQERKLFVVRGVAEYANSPRQNVDRRPRQAGYELLLRHSRGNIRLVRAGDFLHRGWSVTGWVQPGAGEPVARISFLETCLLSEPVLRRLEESGEFHTSDQERDALEVWCKRRIREIGARPPYAAWCAYDFLTQRSLSGIGNDWSEEPTAPVGALEPLRHHPVHGAQEDWFEQFMGAPR